MLFGTRALEAGRPVEGIFYSRGNTPEPAGPSHSATTTTTSYTSLWSHVPQKHTDFDVEKQDAIPLHDRSASNSTTGTTRPSSAGPDAAPLAEHNPNSKGRRNSSPDAIISRPLRSRHPPSSLSKFSGTPYLYRQDSATSTLQALDSIYRASGPMRDHEDYSAGDDTFGSNQSSAQSSSESADTEPIAASAPKLLNHQSRPRKHSTDLDLMHSHRISQAAETGQLTPRTRRPGYSGEWAGLANGAHATFDSGNSSVPARSRSPSPEKKLSRSRRSIQGLPEIDSLSPEVRRSSLPEVTSFAKFCQTAPISPRLELHKMNGADRTQPSRLESEGLLNSAASSADPISPAKPLRRASGEPSSQRPPQSKRGSFEHRPAAIIRGHGTGFEILAPGTLDLPTQPQRPAHKHRSSFSISLNNSASRSRSSSVDSRRKLQKKRQPSMDSTT